MKQHSICIIFFFLVCLFFQPRAQGLSLKKRIELATEAIYDDPKILPLGEKGVLVAADNYETKGKNGDVRVWFCNNELDLIKTWDYHCEYDVQEITLFKSKEEVYVEIDGWKCGEHNYYKIAIPSLQSTPFTLAIDGRCGMGHPTILGDKLLGVSYVDWEAYYTEIPLSTGTTQFTPLGKTKNDQLLSFQVDLAGGLTGILIEKNYLRPSISHVLRVFEQGKSIVDLNIDDVQENRIFSGTLAKLPDGSILLIGTYHRQKFAGDEGIYVAQINGGSLTWIKYHHFTTFKHYFEYLKEGAEKRMEARTELANAHGKDPLINQYLWLHNVYHVNGKYYVIGEAYHATEVYLGNGQSTFGGNEYTHAMIACIDAEGNLVWDQLMMIWLGYRPKEEKRVVRPMFLKDRIVLAYPAGTSVAFEAFGLDGQVLMPYDDVVVDKGNHGEELMGTNAYLEHWYGNHFIVTGRQDVKGGTMKEMIFLEDFVYGN